MKKGSRSIKWIAAVAIVLFICLFPWKKMDGKSTHQKEEPKSGSQILSSDSQITPDDTISIKASDQGGATANLSDEYPYSIAEDRKNFDASAIDIKVGDRLYMTQINDWYTNFKDYKDKTVKIEGYYIVIGDQYTFVGRNGPTCPYCTGGYVDFEFKTDQDLSNLVPMKTWISVSGILREGKAHLANGKTKPFYYIEAIRITAMDEPGINPIKD